MIIDAHAHAGGEFNNPDNIIKILDKYRVDKILLCPPIKNNSNLSAGPQLEIKFIKESVTYGWVYINPAIRILSYLLRNKKQDWNTLIFKFADQYPDRIIRILWINPAKSNSIQFLHNKLSCHKIKI